MCHGSGARLSAIAGGVTWRLSRTAAETTVAKWQAGIRQEMADSLLRVREEMHTATNGKLDAISSISSAMQRLSAGPAVTTRPYRISDLISKTLDGNSDKGQFRNFMAELHWMQSGES